MSKDPVATDELRHDIESAKRRAEQDRLEAKFKRDPDWDLVAEHLIKRETAGDLCNLVWDIRRIDRSIDHDILKRARILVGLAIEQCARDYAEKEAGK
jgi:hypothetical protein